MECVHKAMLASRENVGYQEMFTQIGSLDGHSVIITVQYHQLNNIENKGECRRSGWREQNLHSAKEMKNSPERPWNVRRLSKTMQRQWRSSLMHKKRQQINYSAILGMLWYQFHPNLYFVIYFFAVVVQPVKCQCQYSQSVLPIKWQIISGRQWTSMNLTLLYLSFFTGSSL